MTTITGKSEQDAEQLRKLGYTPRFDRSMSFMENFSLGFTYLSPVVGVYAVLVLGLVTGGPMMIWTYLVAGIGQFLVALIFGEIVSQFPIAGGIYPWARRLAGRRWSWITGWIYGWALFTTIAAISVGVGPFVMSVLSIESTEATTAIAAVGLVVLAAAANLRGTRFLARVAKVGFVCEMLGAVGIGAYLLLFHRVNDLGVIFDTFGLGSDGSYLPAFLAAGLAGLYAIYGFEACGDVAEETPDPGRRIPAAMRMTIIAGVAACLFVTLALILAMPNLADVVAGKVDNPMDQLLDASFGPVGGKIVAAVVAISFLSASISPMAAAGRLMFSYARDHMIVASDSIGKLSPTTHVPALAILIASALAIIIIILGYFTSNALMVIVSFATGGIYFSYLMVLLGALYARTRGWRPSGSFSLGGLGFLINLIAIVWTAGSFANLAWPRTPDAPWFVNYGTLVGFCVVAGAGIMYMIATRPYARSDRPDGDAWQRDVVAEPKPVKA